MSLFDGLEDLHHQYGVDNLYMSAKFCKDAWNHPNKIKLHGVTRKGGRGLPSTVIQDEVQNKVEQEKVRGTVLASKLDGDVTCPSLLAVSVYDTKPVHFLTMAAEKICWEEKKREVYDKQTGGMKEITFHRLNINDDYNYGMGGADIADQIRGSYRFDHWLRRYKWWHSIFWWGIQVLMVNSYRCYVRFHNMNDIDPVSHYQYQTMIAYAWLDDDYYQKCGKGGGSVSSLSTNTNESQRRSRVSSSSLHPITGSLKCRMNRCVHHWPSPADTSKYTVHCQLHFWATGKRVYKNVQVCKECNVSLCTDKCYERFHMTWDLVEEKESIAREYEAKLNDDKK